MNLDELVVLFGFIAACALAAGTGIFIRPGNWYQNLKKPAWRPPDWLFGPVWLVLYLSIALSGWLVWRQAGFTGAAAAFFAFGLQLVLNALWSFIFFGLRRPGLAFAEIILLWISIAALIALFLPWSPFAAYLLVPYAGWVAFAGLLNYHIWRLNPKTT